MGDLVDTEGSELTLPTITPALRPSVAGQVFQVLQERILTLELPPLTRISETDIAARMGVSRQPVREAFKRLERLGFLQIRPQSGTMVSLISEEAILRARFIRNALERQTIRAACILFSQQDIDALQRILDRQKLAVEKNDRNLFHSLDEDFHRAICTRSGHDYVWDLIHDHKAHMDRVRMLSLTSTSQKLALSEHIAILDAIAEKDVDAAADALTGHLARIETLIAWIKAENHNWFLDMPE